MNKLLFKIKGCLGICQCDKCWHRSLATLKIKQVAEREICEKHLKFLLEDNKEDI